MTSRINKEQSVNQNAIRILLVEDSPEYGQVLQNILTSNPPYEFQVDRAVRLDEAHRQMAQFSYDVVLLELTLPDSHGLDTFTRTHSLAPETPIVVITDLDDESMAVTAVREGAQDYLIKGESDKQRIARSLRYAVERQRTVARLQRMTLLDELTGLLNRRGFLSLANQHLKISRRAGRSLTLFFADMDNLKGINDRYGHLEGDQALIAFANILVSTFRSSDVIARLGGDEFTVLAIDAEGYPAQILERLQSNVAEFNRSSSSYQISASIGFAMFDPHSDMSLNDLLEKADQALYEEKRSKRMR